MPTDPDRDAPPHEVHAIGAPVPGARQRGAHDVGCRRHGARRRPPRAARLRAQGAEDPARESGRSSRRRAHAGERPASSAYAAVMPEGDTLFALARDLHEAFAGTTPKVTSPQGKFDDGAAKLNGRRLLRATRAASTSSSSSPTTAGCTCTSA